MLKNPCAAVDSLNLSRRQSARHLNAVAVVKIMVMLIRAAAYSQLGAFFQTVCQKGVQLILLRLEVQHLRS